jgi:hypothetical protein
MSGLPTTSVTNSDSFEKFCETCKNHFYCFVEGKIKKSRYRTCEKAYHAGQVDENKRLIQELRDFVLDYFSPKNQVEHDYKGTITEKELLQKLSELENIEEE